jgi:2-oxo-4-hydroxy-4-carboxy-5-ureidoimidazoline decarboxylase
MEARRPFADTNALLASADEVWAGLGPADWKEAFAHHPRIGDKQALRERFAATRQWAAGEQAGVSGASEAALDALAEGNRDYESRFGHIFIVCATGKTAEEMLALLRERLGNDPEIEERIAAGEQAKITRIRLEKLLAS